MQFIRNHTTLWRATCGFEKYGVDYRDYIRGTNAGLDIILFHDGRICNIVEYINIRGNFGYKVTVPFWQPSGAVLYTSTSLKNCEFDGTLGAIPNEFNFGYYSNTNPAFRCTENQDGTTQIWFGDYV